MAVGLEMTLGACIARGLRCIAPGICACHRGHKGVPWREFPHHKNDKWGTLLNRLAILSRLWA